MLLRNKALAVIIVALIILVAVVYAASQVILMGSYASLEDNSTRSAVDTALREINYEISSLVAADNDYASWDDTYAFVEDGNPSYIESNMGDNTLLNLRLNIMLYVNASGGLVYGKSVDLESGEETPLPAGLPDNLKAGSPLLDTQDRSAVSGVLMLPSGPLLVAACPILMSDGSGAPRGTLIMGRYLNEEEIALLSEISGLEMTIQPYSGQSLPADFGTAAPMLAGNDTVVLPVDGDTISGYRLVRDVYGNPALIVRVDSPRLVYQQGQASVGYFMLALALSGLAMGLIAMFVMQRTAIGRISRLSESVRRIGAENDLTVRLPERGDDEVAGFAHTMNTTLDELERYRKINRDSDQRFRNLVENINDVVWEADGDLKLTYVSPQARDVMGYEPAALLGRSPFELVDPGERVQVRSAIHEMIARKDSFALVEFAITRPDGGRAEIEVGGNPIRDTEGGIVGYRGITRDIGERKRAEEALMQINDELESRVQMRTAELLNANSALQESERKYRELVQYANSMIIRFDADGRILYFNEFACSFFGYSQDEIIGMNVLETIVPRAESSGRNLFQHMKDLLKQPDEYMINVNENVRRNGERVWVSWTNKVMFDRAGRFEGILAIGNDITGLKHASDELKRVNDSLEYRVQQRTAELASAVQALQAEIAERKRIEAQIQSSLQEKEVLLKEIHHRVKNNLQIISSLLSLQSEKINSENPAKTFRESQDRIRSMALIHEKLYQSKDISRVDFAEYVRSLTAYLSRSYVTGPGIEIAIDIRDVSLGIDIAIPCGLIINELVSNSLKYAFPDGRSGVVRIGLARCGNEYTLTVSDSGVGLSAGLDFRNTSSLGLQLVNTLVCQLEGTIELDSSHGTMFRITFAGQKTCFPQTVAS